MKACAFTPSASFKDFSSWKPDSRVGFESGSMWELVVRCRIRGVVSVELAFSMTQVMGCRIRGVVSVVLAFSMTLVMDGD